MTSQLKNKVIPINKYNNQLPLLEFSEIVGELQTAAPPVSTMQTVGKYCSLEIDYTKVLTCSIRYFRAVSLGSIIGTPPSPISISNFKRFEIFQSFFLKIQLPTVLETANMYWN